MSVARTYAKALFETVAGGNGTKKSSLASIGKSMDQFIEALEKSRPLSIALLGPAASAKEKAAIVESIAKKAKYPEMLTRFLTLLARKRRMGELHSIRKALDEVRLEEEGGVLGEVVCADSMSDAELKDLKQSFEGSIGKKVEFNVTSDASLLAGLKVTVNGVTYDGSLRGQLDRLRDQLSEGPREN